MKYVGQTYYTQVQTNKKQLVRMITPGRDTFKKQCQAYRIDVLYIQRPISNISRKQKPI